MFKELTIALSAGAISAGIVIYYFTNKNNNDQLWFKTLLDKQYRLIETFYNQGTNGSLRTSSLMGDEQKNKFRKDTYNNVEEQINQALNITSDSPSPTQIQNTSEQPLNSDYTNVEHSDAVGLPKRSSSLASFFDSISLSQLKK